MGSPPVDGGRHRQHEPDIGAPRTIMFTTSLPDRDIDQLTVHVPAPRAALDPPTEVIRHVVAPPQPSYDPFDDLYWDGDVVQDRGHARRPPPTRGGRWGVVLGALVVTGCAAYIAVVGIGGLRGDAARPASAALAAPPVSYPASAVPPSSAEAVAPTSTVAVKKRAPVARATAPVTTTAAPPVTVTVPPTSRKAAGLAAQEQEEEPDVRDDGTPQLADPPPSPAASPSPSPGPRPQTARAATPPSAAAR